MTSKLLSEKIVVQLLLSIVWGNQAQNDYSRMMGAKCKWCSMPTLNSVPYYLFDIQTTPPQLYTVHPLALWSIVRVRMPGVSEMCHSVIKNVPKWDGFETIKLNAHRTCESLIWESEHMYWQLGQWSKYPHCFIPYIDIHSKTINWQPTLTLSITFLDFWTVQSLPDAIQCGMMHCNHCKNRIQVSYHSDARSPSMYWLVLSDNVADEKCMWLSRGW